MFLGNTMIYAKCMKYCMAFFLKKNWEVIKRLSGTEALNFLKNIFAVAIN